ncbi:MAG: hypothetical protein AAFN16_00905 [Pseudomonadota bacterium]
MFGLFSSKKNIVEAEQEHWLLTQSAWLDANVGFSNTPVPLVTPTDRFFTRPPSGGHERAQHVFQDVKQLMGMQDWDCILREQEEDINPHVDELLVVQNLPQSPLGTFRVESAEEFKIVITYNPANLSNTHALIATFAHELSHYLLACCDAKRTCDIEEEEFLTDLLAIKCGFGLFLANAKFNFNQFNDGLTQGWRSSSSGYLTEHEIIFALMVFLHQNDHDIEEAKPYLKSHLYSLLKSADRSHQQK